jgi:hypothetical protein
MNDGPAGLNEEYGLTPMSFVTGGVGKRSVDIYIGDKIAAGDIDLLRAHGITSVLNTAVNVDFNYVNQQIDAHPGGNVLMFGHSPIRMAKVGMIDGPGNLPSLLLAAVHTVEGLLHQDSPTKASHPRHKPGNLLIHCRAGRSRSVIVAVLYLHLKYPEKWPSFEQTLDFVREQRCMPLDDYEKVPTPAMMELARTILEEVRISGRPMFPIS